MLLKVIKSLWGEKWGRSIIEREPTHNGGISGL
jgi:hypothetical protein